MGAQVVIDDPSEVRSRVQSIAAGVRLVLFSTAAGTIYALTTWDGAKSGRLLGLLGGMAALGVIAWMLPSERIVRSRHRETCFLLWSIAQIGLIGALAAT